MPFLYISLYDASPSRSNGKHYTDIDRDDAVMKYQVSVDCQYPFHTYGQGGHTPE